MFWLFAGRRLRNRGVLGINRRNALGILDRNPSGRFSVVDDKFAMADLCQRIGTPTPAILAAFGNHRELRYLPDLLEATNDFVIKPARGFGGRGVWVVSGREQDKFVLAGGRVVDQEALMAHAADILAGGFSLGGKPDTLLIQRRVRPHSAFASVAPGGVADIRIIVYRFEPAMAMLRLPTLASGGRANLQQGGVGVGIDLATGRASHAVWGSRMIVHHPDTGSSLLQITVPRWGHFLEIARNTSRAAGLGFVGIDLVLDENDGPLLLEANARPGLAIQLANQRGLEKAMRRIDLLLEDR